MHSLILFSEQFLEMIMYVALEEHEGKHRRKNYYEFAWAMFYDLKYRPTADLNTVELQWLEHWWILYHGCFELVLESLGKIP